MADIDSITRTQVSAAVHIVAAVGQAIKEAGQVPEGELYAVCMAHMDLSQFNSCIDTLVRCKMVRKSNHLLTWVG
jgi:hypothetical protein